MAPDRPGLLWQAAGVLASHRLAVRSANATSHGNMAVAAFTVAPEYGDPPMRTWSPATCAGPWRGGST